jgi:hypothetical protein
LLLLLLLLLLDSLFYLASLALVNSEISRYYHVAGHAQPAGSESESLSSSFHQFIQSVPVVGGHPSWIKAACRCACLLPDDWQGRLSEHAVKISALFTTSAPQGLSSARSDEGAFFLRPSSSLFKPNLASSLKATAEQWKRDGFDLFEKGSSCAGSSSRTLSGSQSIEHLSSGFSGYGQDLCKYNAMDSNHDSDHVFKSPEWQKTQHSNKRTRLGCCMTAHCCPVAVLNVWFTSTTT